MLQKSIAFFDFDGTITKKDTMLEFARFSSGTFNYWLGMCKISPWLIAMKLRLLSKSEAKEKLLAHFFKDTDEAAFNKKCISFSEKILPHLIRQDAMAAIKKHKADKTPVIVVSASAENWVAPWCKLNDLQFICTRLKIIHNKITGKLYGENCNGNEKVCRIRELFNLSDYTFIYCYGDTLEDTNMLDLATHPHYREFKN